MLSKFLLSFFLTLLFSLTCAQMCPPPEFIQKMEQLNSNTPNCFCVASIPVPTEVSPSADLIQLSFLVGEGPLINRYRPAQIRCARERSFNPSRQQGQCCFGQRGREVCVPLSESQKCLVSMLSLSSEICPPSPGQGALSGRGGFQPENGGFQPGNGGFGGFGGFGFQSPSVTPEPDDRR